jgi:microfibrillar-associated protein 1
MMERMKVQQEELPMEDEDGDDDEEDSSEYETDSEDEGPGGRQMLKPVFVKKVRTEPSVRVRVRVFVKQ